MEMLPRGESPSYDAGHNLRVYPVWRAWLCARARCKERHCSPDQFGALALSIQRQRDASWEPFIRHLIIARLVSFLLNSCLPHVCTFIGTPGIAITHSKNPYRHGIQFLSHPLAVHLATQQCSTARLVSRSAARSTKYGAGIPHLEEQSFVAAEHIGRVTSPGCGLHVLFFFNRRRRRLYLKGNEARAGNHHQPAPSAPHQLRLSLPIVLLHKSRSASFAFPARHQITSCRTCWGKEQRRKLPKQTPWPSVSLSTTSTYRRPSKLTDSWNKPVLRLPSVPRHSSCPALILPTTRRRRARFRSTSASSTIFKMLLAKEPTVSSGE